MRTVIFSIEIRLSTFYQEEDYTETPLEIDSTCSVTRDSFLSGSDETYYPPRLFF